MRWFGNTDTVRHILARFDGPPQIEPVQPAASQVMKYRITGWVRAFGNHGQLTDRNADHCPTLSYPVTARQWCIRTGTGDDHEGTPDMRASKAGMIRSRYQLAVSKCDPMVRVLHCRMRGASIQIGAAVMNLYRHLKR